MKREVQSETFVADDAFGSAATAEGCRFLRIRQGSCITAGIRRTDMSQHGIERAIGTLVTDEAAS